MELTSYEIISHNDDYIKIKLHDIFFHPQGGGQPDDKLYDKSGAAVDILKEDGNVYLQVKASSVDQNKIEVFIDEDFREECSKLHSAGHLVALTVSSLYDVAPIKAHHFPSECYIKFSSVLPPEELDSIESSINDKVKYDAKVVIDESDELRLVNFEGIGGYPCGGTHVNSLSEIGQVRIDKISNKKGQSTVKYSLY